MRNDDKTSLPLVSVVIPFYRNVGWLCEAVDSVLQQDYKNYEIIVVNDGSSEDVSEFLDRYQNKIRYFYKENGGAASARNLGIREAQGEYIAFLDSDDLWKENKLSLQIAEMIKHNAVWSYCDFETFGDNTKTVVKHMTKKDIGIYNFVSPYIGTPTVVIQKNILILNSFQFDENLKYGQDAFLWECIIDKYPILFINQCLASVRIRGNNAGKRASVQIKARVKIYDKCIKKIPNYKKKKSFIYRTAISFCRFGGLFVKEDSKSKFNELIAKVFFLCPYLLFKTDRLFNKNF